MLLSPVLLVRDHHHLDALRAAGRTQRDHVAFLGPHQRACDGGDPADLAALGVGLVDADDAQSAFFDIRAAVGVGVGDGGTEEHSAAVFLPRRIDDLGTLDALGEIA